MPQVSVVIPNYNGSQLLSKHLPAVIKALRQNDEIIIVDDSSQDNSVQWLKEVFIPSTKVPIKLLVNDHNLRFGATVNRGVAAAQYGLVLLLNNDVSPKPDLLKHLLPHFSHPEVFAVGCLEIEDEAERKHSGKNKLWFERGLFFHSRSDDLEAGETAWAVGGSAMFDREKWLELGGFDSAYYPAYWEDIDLSYRAKQRGWSVLFEPNAQVYHRHETTNQDIFGQEKIKQISWRNAQRFLWKNGTLVQKLLWILWQPYWWWQRLK